MLELGLLVSGIIITSFVLGRRNAEEKNVEGIIDLVITKLCHDGYIHYEEMDDGDYDLIKIEDFDNGNS
jgi:hypothetical protein|tara:strand:+ start:990 stop:1196 length:207 start_codon:yes stop_codon:yes gene_type:complete